MCACKSGASAAMMHIGSIFFICCTGVENMYANHLVCSNYQLVPEHGTGRHMPHLHVLSVV